MGLILKGADLVTPFQFKKNSSVRIEDNKIVQLIENHNIKHRKEDKIIDLTGKTVIPGLVDIHIHGIGGYDFNNISPGDMDNFVNILLKHGITGILMTLFPQKHKEFIKTIRNTVDLVSKLKKHNIIFGLHLEGPFLNKKMHGALNPDYLWEPSMEDWYSIYESARGYLKIMTIAPELPGCMDIIRDAATKGVVLSIGHTEATYKEVQLAIDNGVTHVTHIYNAMHPTHHREPGVLGTCYVSDELKIEMIADGIHIHPVTIKFLVKLKGDHNIILISDAISAAGQPDGKYIFADQSVTIKNGKAYLDNKTIAGSCLTLDVALKNMIELVETNITSAVRMASLNPLRVLGKDSNKGIISVGKDADLVVLNKNNEVEMTILQGEIVYNKNQ